MDFASKQVVKDNIIRLLSDTSLEQDAEVERLKKANWYLEKLIESYKKTKE